MTIPQVDADAKTVWRYKRIPDAKYYFLYQVGDTVYYKAVISDDDREPFQISVHRWLENYERID